jgi:hypothetical protein
VPRLCLSLRRLAGRLGIRVGVVRVCAWRISVSTAVLVTAIVAGISEVCIVGLGGGLAGDSSCSSGSRGRQWG